MSTRVSFVRSGLFAALFYLAVSVGTTWPLASGLGRDLPWDLGDSLLNCWILGWNAHRLLRAAAGDPSALAGYWDANIFFPEPLTLAYSEHLFAESLQILPIYAATGNLILCYNLLFLSTFVLSGLGVFLLVRHLTGSAGAGLIAGLCYAFAPYRIAQYSHLQVLASQWMPFALLGLRRFFETGRAGPLAGAVAALVAQNLSCGYFLAFFTPAAGIYAVYEVVSRRLWRRWQTMTGLLVAALLVAGLTWPFLSPYLALRRAGQLPRSLDEVRSFSADVYSYATTHPRARVWGDVLAVFPKPEGELFPGMVPLLLAAIGVGVEVRRTWRGTMGTTEPIGPTPRERFRRVTAVASAGVVLVQLALVIATLVTADQVFWLGPLRVSTRRLGRAMLVMAGAGVVAVASSARLRRAAASFFTGPVCFYAFLTIAAFVLSLGPSITSMGRDLGDGPYRWLHALAPGYDGLRVPARFGMVVVFGLAVLAGFGAVWILACRTRSRPYLGRVLTAALVTGFLVESTAAPILVNGVHEETVVRTPAAGVDPPELAPPVFRFLDTLPEEAVVLHLPFGWEQYDLRWMYYSTLHWRRLVNGYSGHFPARYYRQHAAFVGILTDPDAAWQEITASGATHIVVHEEAFKGDEGITVAGLLATRGARTVGVYGRAHVLGLPRHGR